LEIKVASTKNNVDLLKHICYSCLFCITCFLKLISAYVRLVTDGSLDLLSKGGFKKHNGALKLNDIYGLFKWYPFTAVQYAELKPVPCLTYSDAEMLREKCATPILKQVFSASGHRMSEINFN